MRLKFWILTALLLFSRGCDFYSTSLWFFQPGGMADETNVLTRFLGAGWEGLVLANLLVVGLVIAGYYYYVFRYRPERVTTGPRNYLEYASAVYFGRNDRFYRIFYQMPKNWRAAAAHTGYVLIRVLIVAGLLATGHNLGQYHDPPFYDAFRDLVGRPLYVIYGLILLSVVLFYLRLLRREYRNYLKKIDFTQSERYA